MRREFGKRWSLRLEHVMQILEDFAELFISRPDILSFVCLYGLEFHDSQLMSMFGGEVDDLSI
jgi:hypothetical protein